MTSKGSFNFLYIFIVGKNVSNVCLLLPQCIPHERICVFEKFGNKFIQVEQKKAFESCFLGCGVPLRKMRGNLEIQKQFVQSKTRRTIF